VWNNWDAHPRDTILRIVAEDIPEIEESDIDQTLTHFIYITNSGMLHNSHFFEFHNFCV